MQFLRLLDKMLRRSGPGWHMIGSGSPSTCIKPNLISLSRVPMATLTVNKFMKMMYRIHAAPRLLIAPYGSTNHLVGRALHYTCI